MTSLRGAVLVALLAAFAVPSADAQVGSTTEIITGIIRGENGVPIADVIVTATSLETKVSRQARTDAKGRYTILFPDGGGQYQVVARLIGMIPGEKVVVRQTDEDRLEADFILAAQPQQLDELQVRSGRTGPVRIPELPTPGTVERLVTPELAARLPLDPSDLNILALLAPGVVAVEGSDTTAAGFSVAGQRPGSNAITVDGMSFGSSSVPQDAVRSTRIITNTFDAARGQFSGGQVATMTRSGTNVLQGTFNYGLRDDALTLDGGTQDPFASGYTQHQISGGIGGPVINNRLFLFGSFQARLRNDNLQSLLVATPETLTRLGTHPDSAARFQEILTGLGVPVTAYNTDARNTDALSGLARLDWLVTSNHTLTLRGDWRRNTTDPSRISPLSLPQTGGAQLTNGGGGMLSLASRFGRSFLNEAKVYYGVNDGSGDPFLAVPQGRVQVTSSLDDGSQGVSTLSFGGNPGLPQANSTGTLEVTEEISWLSGSAAHRPKLGLLYNRSSTTQSAAGNRYGSYSFNSLADLESGRPASFTRTLVPTEREGVAVNSALYLADTWRPVQGLQFTFGGRLEYATASGAPAYSPVVDSLFGRRTDALPEELHLSPRMGFTLNLGQGSGGGPFGGTVLRGGIGEFRSTISPQLLASAQSPTGVSPAEFQLVCIGAGVPIPDWEAYFANPASIPGNCEGGVPGPSANRSPTFSTFSPDFGAPRNWRTSLGVQRRIGFAQLSADLSYAHGVRQTGFSDLNLVADPRFRLAGEANRPVYVPASAIFPTTGAVDFLQSRQYAQFGQVLSVDADLQSESFQLALSAGGITTSGILYNASYTLARSQDQSSFGGGFGGGSGGAGGGFGSSTTAGNPNEREWAASDFDRRHSIVLTGTVPIGTSLEFTTVGRITSGAPYTPRVGSDINGDGSRNDRAFIYSPTLAADTAMANGMSRLLAGASGGAKACLESQLGTIAGRNSCRAPWQPALDLQLNWRPDFWGLRQKMMVSLVTINFLGGVDRLFHGADNLRGWGQPVRPDATLLYVNGFDPATRQFRYTVNERFGSARNSATAVVSPFQVGFQVRYTLGPDRQREMMAAVRGGGGFGGGRGGFGGPGAGGPGAGGDFMARFATLIPNPAEQILELRLGLRLDEDQVRRLTALRDSAAARNKQLGDTVQAQIARAGSRPDPARLMGLIRPLLEQGQAGLQADLKTAEAILTPEQWGQVPERIKSPPGRFGGQRPGQRPPGD